MPTYKNMSEMVLLNRLGEAGDKAKAELFETWDQIRDLAVSGPTLGGAGLGGVGGFLFKMAQLLSGSSFLPVLGSTSINIPGTSYYYPITGGTGTQPGAQSSFGVGPFSQFSGLPAGGSAAGLDALSILASYGIGSTATAGSGFGSQGFHIAGAAAPIGAGSGLATLGATGAGLATAAGFGRNWVIPMAGLVSGIGGLLTTLSPFFGGAGLAGLATGTILSGLSGSLLSAYQHVSSRILVNADTILTTKAKNLEATIKQLEAQEEIVKKLLKDSLEGDKKALQDL